MPLASLANEMFTIKIPKDLSILKNRKSYWPISVPGLHIVADLSIYIFVTQNTWET